MEITVLLWAQMRIAAGSDRVRLDLPDGTAVSGAVDRLYAAYPALARFRGNARIAVGTEYAPPDRILLPGEEVSLIPPVQGG